MAVLEQGREIAERIDLFAEVRNHKLRYRYCQGQLLA